MKLKRSEVARYLGYRGKPLTEEIEELVLLCEAQLFEKGAPRHLGRKIPRAQLQVESRDMDRHLRDATEVWLTVLTLGSEVDRLLRVWSVENMGKAAVGQACCAVWMDDICDAYLLELKEKLPEGEYLLPPFSPGYGDFPLDYQGTLLGLLDASRRLGVSLTQGGMLVPEKTVTQVVGITKLPTERCVQSCHACPKADCDFRKG